MSGWYSYHNISNDSRPGRANELSHPSKSTTRVAPAFVFKIIRNFEGHGMNKNVKQDAAEWNNDNFIKHKTQNI